MLRITIELNVVIFNSCENQSVVLPQVKLVNIRNDDIADGNPKLTLGLIWTIILHFQVSSSVSVVFHYFITLIFCLWDHSCRFLISLEPIRTDWALHLSLKTWSNYNMLILNSFSEVTH